MNDGKLKTLVAGVAMGLLLQAQPLWACAVCYGESDSPMAKGLTWGVSALLAVVVCVLAGIASFFVFLARKSSTDKAP